MRPIHLLALLLLPCGLLAEDEELREDWLAMDVAVAKRVAALVPPVETPAPELLKKLAPCDVREDRDIGFGARRYFVAVYGGYTTTWITFVAHRDRIGAFEAVLEDEDAAVVERVRTEWKGKKIEERPGGFRYACGLWDEPRSLLDARVEALGAPYDLEPPEELLSAYLTLVSPLQRLVYGTMFGDDGAPPPGREELEKIVAHKRGADVLASILREGNPEGRVYAAEGLLRLKQKGARLREDDLKALAVVRSLEIPIECGDGCELFAQTAAKALAAAGY